MSSAYANRLFIITGGCGGFGKGFAEQILRNKGKVVLSDISEETGEKLAAELEKKFGKKQNLFFIAENVILRGDDLKEVCNAFEHAYDPIEIDALYLSP